MKILTASIPMPPWQFALFRMVLGIYLAWHFAELVPFAPELFSHAGVLPRADLNLTYRAFPNILALFDAPRQTQLFIGVLAVISISFAAGWHRRTCAILLWYGWACLFNRNNLISNPGIPYVGLLLILSAIVPRGEPFSVGRKPDPNWSMPAIAFWGAWFLLAAGYTYSGAWKLFSPSWQDGSAIHHLLTNPLARPSPVRDLMLALPWGFLVALTWITLVGELIFLPLSLSTRGRAIAWLWMMGLHASVLLVVDFADLTMGMLMIHLFTFDPAWLRSILATARSGRGISGCPAVLALSSSAGKPAAPPNAWRGF